MRIKWIGHSCFLIEANDGRKIMTDPYDPSSIDYIPPEFEADVVLVSHQHFDHNYVQAVKGSPLVIDKQGDHEYEGMSITGVHTFHDDSQGKERGDNLIFKFRMDGVTLAHCGDLGHTLTGDQLNSLQDVEAVFIPVGGVYTIDPQQAAEISLNLKSAKVIFPMHYKTDKLSSDDFPLAGVDDFISHLPEADPKHLQTSDCRLSKSNLPVSKEIWILNPLQN